MKQIRKLKHRQTRYDEAEKVSDGSIEMAFRFCGSHRKENKLRCTQSKEFRYPFLQRRRDSDETTVLFFFSSRYYFTERFHTRDHQIFQG